jgi:hypothetical protein
MIGKNWFYLALMVSCVYVPAGSQSAFIKKKPKRSKRTTTVLKEEIGDNLRVVLDKLISMTRLVGIALVSRSPEVRQALIRCLHCLERAPSWFEYNELVCVDCNIKFDELCANSSLQCNPLIAQALECVADLQVLVIDDIETLFANPKSGPYRKAKSANLCKSSDGLAVFCDCLTQCTDGLAMVLDYDCGTNAVSKKIG